MKYFIIIILAGLGGQALAKQSQDSIKVDEQKIKMAIKKIKKSTLLKRSRQSIKDFDIRKITFSYPRKFTSREGLSIEIEWQGQVILIYGLKPDTYELDEIVDLR